MAKDELELLEGIHKWLEFLGRQQAIDVVVTTLNYQDEEKNEAARIAYQLTNGENTTKDIAEHIPFSYRWVSSRHQEWATQGIVKKEGPQEPYEHIMSLDELGIAYPDIPEVVEK